MIAVENRNPKVETRHVPVHIGVKTSFGEIQKLSWFSPGCIRQSAVDDFHYKIEILEDYHCAISIGKKIFAVRRGIVSNAAKERDLIDLEIIRRTSKNILHCFAWKEKGS